MSGKKLRGVCVSRNMQGYIRYTCLTYRDQPKHVREKIARLCRECGGEYGAALWELVCTEESAVSIALRHHVSEATLYRARKKFYESWGKKRKRG